MSDGTKDPLYTDFAKLMETALAKHVLKVKLRRIVDKALANHGKKKG